MAEPFSPTWNTALLEKLPFDHIAAGELIDKPIIFETADNEGYGFIRLVFWGVANDLEDIQDWDI